MPDAAYAAHPQIMVDENVLIFDVAMHDSELVHVPDGVDDLRKHDPRLLLRKLVVLDALE